MTRLVRFRPGMAHISPQLAQERAAEADGQIAVVHGVGDQRLRMQGVSHIDAVPGVRLGGDVDRVARLGQNAGNT